MLNQGTLNQLPTLKPFILTEKFILSDNIFNLLHKGPSFIPSNKILKCRYVASINDFIRKFQWIMILKNQSYKSFKVPIPRSTRWPPKNSISAKLKNTCEQILYSCLNILNKSNLPKSSADLSLAKELKNSNDYIITKVDKGSNWIITCLLYTSPSPRD